MEEAIEALDRVEYRLSLSSHLAILADAKHQSGDTRGAKALSARAMQIVDASGERWFEPEIRRTRQKPRGNAQNANDGFHSTNRLALDASG